MQFFDLVVLDLGLTAKQEPQFVEAAKRAKTLFPYHLFNAVQHIPLDFNGFCVLGLDVKS